jgi:hypothetical protein
MIKQPEPAPTKELEYPFVRNLSDLKDERNIPTIENFDWDYFSDIEQKWSKNNPFSEKVVTDYRIDIIRNPDAGITFPIITANNETIDLTFKNDYKNTFPSEIVGYSILKMPKISLDKYDFNINNKYILIITRWLNPSGKVSFLHFVSPLVEYSLDGIDYGFAPIGLVENLHLYGKNNVTVYPVYKWNWHIEKYEHDLSGYDELVRYFTKEYGDPTKLIKQWIDTDEIPDELQKILLAPAFRGVS